MSDAVRIGSGLHTLIHRSFSGRQCYSAMANLSAAAADVNRSRGLMHIDVARLADRAGRLRWSKSNTAISRSLNLRYCWFKRPIIEIDRVVAEKFFPAVASVE